MRTVWVELEDGAYPVEIGAGLMERVAELLAAHLSGSKVLLVSDPQVAPLHMERAAAGLRSGRRTFEQVVVPAGEGSKDLTNFGRLLRELGVTALRARRCGGRARRRHGFRPRWFRPSQLPPRHRFRDPADHPAGDGRRQRRRQGRDQPAARQEPGRSVSPTQGGDRRSRNPAYASDRAADRGPGRDPQDRHRVRPDTVRIGRERLPRLVGPEARALPGGHRAGGRAQGPSGGARPARGRRARPAQSGSHLHGLEAADGYQRPTHGEAVLLGLIAAARLARNLDLIDERDQSRIEQLATSLVQRCRPPAIDLELAAQAMLFDKKADDSQLRFVLPRTIGRAEVHAEVPPSAVREALQLLRPLFIS